MPLAPSGPFATHPLFDAFVPFFRVSPIVPTHGLARPRGPAPLWGPRLPNLSSHATSSAPWPLLAPLKMSRPLNDSDARPQAVLALCALALSAAPERAAAEPAQYDYIVVGAGTGGCALASRLAEAEPGKRIALIERGTKRTPGQELKVRALRLAYDAWDDPVRPPSAYCLLSAAAAATAAVGAGGTVAAGRILGLAFVLRVLQRPRPRRRSRKTGNRRTTAR